MKRILVPVLMAAVSVVGVANFAGASSAHVPQSAYPPTSNTSDSGAGVPSTIATTTTNNGSTGANPPPVVTTATTTATTIATTTATTTARTVADPLPRSGTDSSKTIPIAAVIALVGIGLVVISRSRRRRSSTD